MLADAVTLSSDPLTDCGPNTESTNEFWVPIEPPGDAGLVKKPKTHILGSRRPNPGPFGAESRRGNGYFFAGKDRGRCGRLVECGGGIRPKPDLGGSVGALVPPRALRAGGVRDRAQLELDAGRAHDALDTLRSAQSAGDKPLDAIMWQKV